MLENVPSAFYVECVVQVKRDNDGRIVDHELTLWAAMQHPEPAPVPQAELDSEEHRTRHGHYVIGWSMERSDSAQPTTPSNIVQFLEPLRQKLSYPCAYINHYLLQRTAWTLQKDSEIHDIFDNNVMTLSCKAPWLPSVPLSPLSTIRLAYREHQDTGAMTKLLDHSAATTATIGRWFPMEINQTKWRLLQGYSSAWVASRQYAFHFDWPALKKNFKETN